MKVFLISYDSYQYDGRLRELVKVAKMLGDTTYVSRGGNEEKRQETGHILYKEGGYPKFILFVCRLALRIGKQDLILIDNRKGILPGYLAKRLTGAKYVVQDSRELYDIKSAVGIPGKIGCIVEKVFTRHSDVVIAANAHRARMMVKMFGLMKVPLNYENIRRLDYSSEEARRRVEEECKDFFREKKFRIISTAGCDMTRTTGKMVEVMKTLGEAYELLLVGDSDEEDEILVRETIRELGLTNVKVFPRMDQDHLKYFIGNCQIGLVAYHQRDLNNKYCASGKIYEFIFEGKPVVTSTNPTLREFCEHAHVGIADDDYAAAVKSLRKDYEIWEKRVKKYIGSIQVEKNNKRLADKIKRELGITS